MGRLGGLAHATAIFVLLGVCLLLTFVAMLGSERLEHWLGATGIDVVGRVSGVLLAALAVQFVFDGLRHAGI
jgi:multiple antibiotic resistance protein